MGREYARVNTRLCVLVQSWVRMCARACVGMCMCVSALVNVSVCACVCESAIERKRTVCRIVLESMCTCVGFVFM